MDSVALQEQPQYSVARPPHGLCPEAGVPILAAVYDPASSLVVPLDRGGQNKLLDTPRRQMKQHVVDAYIKP